MRTYRILAGRTLAASMSRHRPRAGSVHLAAMLLWAFATAPVALADNAEGVVNFFVATKGDFTAWTDNPTQQQKEKMREYYTRVLAWSPYFDSRLSWLPQAWEYKDAYAVYPDSGTLAEHPEFVLRDAGGNMLYIPFACSGGTCPQYAGDFGNPAYHQWWIDRERPYLERGYLGLYVDDVNTNHINTGNGSGSRVLPIDPRTGREMTLTDWRRYFAEFLEAVRAAFPTLEIVHNVVWYAPLNDPYVQRELLAADYIALERGISDSGIRRGTGTYGFESFIALIEWLHARGKHVILEDDDDDSVEMRDYDLAFYYLVNDGGDLLAADGDRSRMNPDTFWSGYQHDLGRALGPHYRWQELFRRDFECGIVLVNQPEMPTIAVSLGETYTDLEERSVTSATLAAARGTVLRKACSGTGGGAPPPPVNAAPMPPTGLRAE